MEMYFWCQALRRALSSPSSAPAATPALTLNEKQAIDADTREVMRLIREAHPGEPTSPESSSKVVEIPHGYDGRLDRATELCRELSEGTNGNVPIQSVYEAMMKLIGREDVIEQMQRDWEELASPRVSAATPAPIQRKKRP